MTGPKEIGKSYLLDEIITPLCGPIAHIGSGKDSEAGIKRAGIDGGCFILDEMEPRTRADRENIEKILGLIRNASSDSSSKISNAGNGKELVAYTIRQSFMLSSIVPYFGGGNAIKSRFFTCCLKSNIDFEKKKENTLKILSQKILRDPGRFRRRTFSMLKVIEENMLKIKDIVFSCRGSQRDADNIAPLLAAVFSVANDGLITEKYIDNLKRWMLQYTKEVEHDEDALLSDIFESMIKYDNNNITIGQLVYDVMHDGVDAKGYSRCLGMYGIRVCDIQHDGQTKKVVAFAPNNKNLRDILKDTFFGAGYADVLKRYQFALAETVKMRIDGKSVRAIVIDANDIDASYYGKD